MINISFDLQEDKLMALGELMNTLVVVASKMEFIFCTRWIFVFDTGRSLSNSLNASNDEAPAS